MSSIISKASQAIQIWNEVRNNPVAVINYFNQSTYFKITKEDYLIWKDSDPEFIHAYMGLVPNTAQGNFSLSLFSVDSVTDQNPVESHWELFEAKIRQNPYEAAVIPDPSMTLVEKSNEGEITPLEGLTRSIQWALHKDVWIEGQEDLVLVFKIPFHDLKVLFENELADYIILSPALNEQEEANVFKIDLILWGYNANGITWNKPMDLIRPRPPFKSPSNYQLLSYAL